MRSVLTPALLILVLAFAGCAPPSAVVVGPVVPQAPPTVVEGPVIRPGTTLLAALEQPIGTDMSAVGQVYTASLVAPVIDATTSATIIPAGGRILGHVTALRPGVGEVPAVVSLTVDSIEVGGVQHPLPAVIVRADVAAVRHDVRAAPVLGGALGGAFLGAILGGRGGALAGGALGAGAGTAISLGTATTEARLPAGTVIALEITAPVPVAALVGPG